MFSTFGNGHPVEQDVGLIIFPTAVNATGKATLKIQFLIGNENGGPKLS